MEHWSLLEKNQMMIEAAGEDWIAARDIDDESGRVYLAYFEDKGEMEGYLTNWSSDKKRGMASE